MSVTPEQEQAQLDALAIAIRQRAEQAFESMLQRLREGESPRDAIKAVSETFAGEYFSELSTAFSAVLQENVGMATIKAWPVGEVDLSERLYTHLDEVNAVTRGLIADHVKGFVQARTLAMQIYEGYEFKTDPLKVKAKLPKYLREALDDPAVSQGFAQIVGRIRASALKTPALKAAYLQAIDALEAGVGENRLKRLTRVAWYERNRYFANRIAQTELHRAYSNQVASELMEDDEAVWVKVQMSRTHPRVDICDYHAGLNAWGQGPGVYPKAKAPKPPFHPFCRCTVRPAYELDAEAEQVERQDAPQAFMQGRSDYDQRLIAGSRDRLQRFRDGESLEAIYNGATKSTYKWGRLGDTMEAPMALLPNFENAEINERKLSGYALNVNHPYGSHKARKIKASLGFDASHVKDMTDQILNNLKASEAVQGISDEHGQRYSVDMILTGPHGSATVRTGWVVGIGSNVPRMTTVYVRGSKK